MKTILTWTLAIALVLLAVSAFFPSARVWMGAQVGKVDAGFRAKLSVEDILEIAKHDRQEAEEIMYEIASSVVAMEDLRKYVQKSVNSIETELAMEENILQAAREMQNGLNGDKVVAVGGKEYSRGEFVNDVNNRHDRCVVLREKLSSEQEILTTLQRGIADGNLKIQTLNEKIRQEEINIEIEANHVKALAAKVKLSQIMSTIYTDEEIDLSGRARPLLDERRQYLEGIARVNNLTGSGFDVGQDVIDTWTFELGTSGDVFEDIDSYFETYEKISK